jgi:hypothetical protein
MTFDFAALSEGEVEMETPEVQMVPITPGNIEAVKHNMAEYTAQVDQMVTTAQAIQVTDEESKSAAVAFTGNSKRLYKVIEARRKEIIEEPNKFVKSCNNFCKIFTEKLKTVEQTINAKICSYSQEQELKRRKQEQEAQKAAQELQAKLNKHAEKLHVEPIKIDPPIVAAPPKITRTETGITSFEKKRWVCVVVDAALVPREYCEHSMKLLNDAVKQGVREIPGCEIKQITDIITRT